MFPDLHSDTHMHSTCSDGSAAISEMAEAAFEKGMTTIAITDHVPLPFDTRYAMKMANMADYRKEITRVKRLYEGRMAVKSGLEIEYIPGHKDWLASIASMDWDITIASIHTLVAGGTRCLVNGNETDFHTCLNTLFKKDIRALCRAYYHTLQEAVLTGWFDIVGHMDVLKKFNTHHRFFNETDAWYGKLVEDTLDAVRDRKMKLEINMGGMAHPVAEPYPSPWIVKRAQKKGIALVMGSDAHHPGAIGQGFDLVRKMLV
jgi:histidinol-phosphatase (PHP family)